MDWQDEMLRYQVLKRINHKATITAWIVFAAVAVLVTAVCWQLW